MFLPLKSTQSRVVEQELFCLFKNLKNIEILIYLLGKKKIRTIDQKLFCFFTYYLQQKYIFTFRKDKIQGISMGHLCPFTMFFFFCNSEFMEGILVFSIWRNIFLFEKDAET
jgi:hypothetical protein